MLKNISRPKMYEAFVHVITAKDFSSTSKQFFIDRGILNEDGTKCLMHPDGSGVGGLSGLSAIAEPLFSFPIVRNEFLSAFFNKIAKTYVWNKMANNVLSIFFESEVPYGAFSSEVHTNPAEALPFIGDFNSARRFEKAEPDVVEVYHRLNRQEQYKVSVQEPLFIRAFSSFEGLNELVDVFHNTIYNGNTIDRFNYTKQLIGKAFTDNNIIKQVLSDNPGINLDAGKQLSQYMRSLARKFQIPSTNYNAYLTYTDADQTRPRITWCDPEDLVIITTADIEAYLDVNLLANAFNMERAQFLNRIIPIDQFEDADGIAIPNLDAVIMDKRFLHIKTKREIATYEADPAALFYTHFLTIFETYSLSPFANAVAFYHEVEETP